MKKFKYNLESLLHLRGKKEVDLLQLYASQIRVRVESENKYKKELNRLEIVKDSINNMRSGQFKPADQSYYLSEILRLQKLIDNLLEDLNKKEKNEGIARENYLTARAEKGILEKLKERKRIHHFKEQTKLEQKLLDDIVSSSMTNKM